MDTIKCTLQNLKDFKPNGEQLNAAINVFLFMAKVETIKPIVDGYRNAILKAHQWHKDKKYLENGRYKEADAVILDEKHTYMLSDADFKVYLAELHEQHIKHGFNVPLDYCPLLIAEDELRKAKRHFLHTMESLTGINPDDVYKLDLYERLVDINLKFMVKWINKEDCLTQLERVVKK